MWIFPPSTPIVLRLVFLTGEATRVILCGSVSSRWQQLAFLFSGNPSPHGDCVRMAALKPVSSPFASLGGTRQALGGGAGEGRGRRSGQGTDWRSSGRLGGEKLNKQGSRCLKSFWLLLKQLFTLHGEVRGAFHRPLLVGGSAAIDAFVLFCDSFNKQRAASGS